MPRKPTTAPSTPTKGEKTRRAAPPSSRATAASGSPSRANMRIGASTPNPGRHPGAGAVIAAPPRAALGGTSSPAPDDYRNRPAADTATSSTTESKTPTPPPATTADSSLDKDLLEKDTRITHLERELAIMESEFTRELDKLSKSEVETTSFWQAKFSALNQTFLRTDTELRLLRGDLESREQEREEFRSRYEMLAREIRERDEEIRTLKSQIRGLKEWVSTSTRSDVTARTSDEVFGDGMARLGNSLLNWVLVHFRKGRVDLSTVDEGILEELGRLVPMYEDLASTSSTSKLNMIQSLVSRLLVEFVFDAYFVGLSSEQAQHFAHMETFLSSFATSPEPINQWRSMTLTIVKREADQKMQNETAKIIDAVVQKANNILDAITDIKKTEARDQALRVLVSSSIELSRLLVVQRAVFKVTMPEILPHQRIMFDSSTMEDMGGEDEDSLEERELCCVTFPGIIKRGDESGGHLQYRNVISKARVICSPE